MTSVGEKIKSMVKAAAARTAAALTLAVWMCGSVFAIGAAEEVSFESVEDLGQMLFSWLSAPKEEKRGMDAINQLKEWGFDVNEYTLGEIKTRAIETYRSLADGETLSDEMQQMIDGAVQQVETEIQNANVYDILMELGMGDMNYETGEWKPLSNQVYAFDAEVMFVDLMYTQFLQGVQSIVSDIEITDIHEDLSGMTAELTSSDDLYAIPTDGKRAVAFLRSGRPYSIELESHGDWINMDILDFMNQVLEKEGCEKRLHILTGDYDQMVIMIYSTSERAEAIRPHMKARW